ncbi:hypothetical protein NIES4106_61880 (plasmid) [Fischerella sp. NIES-4106]|nr:hypothetical protein NIES4106_61880 [Fischerella sp. NIES-4106]
MLNNPDPHFYNSTSVLEPSTNSEITQPSRLVKFLSYEGKRAKKTGESSSYNPCPVCGDTNTACKFLETGAILCFGHSHLRVGEIVNGYKCVQERRGHTALFVSHNGFAKNFYNPLTPEQRKAKEAQRKVIQEQRQTELEKEIARWISFQLSEQDRDYWWNRILNELSLSDHHKQKLLDRGYTEEQIINEGFKSINAYHKPSFKLPANFPGLRNDGCLEIAGDGILIPGRNHKGLIFSAFVGFDERTKKGKYRPISHSRNDRQNQHHINAEQPVYSHQPNSAKTDFILLCEGGGLKNSLAFYKLNLPVVAAQAGNYASSPENSKAELKAVASKYTTNQLRIALDAGDVGKPQVVDKWLKQYKFLSGLGYVVKFLWWDQLEKNIHPDIDELNDLSQINHIDFDRFIELCDRHGGLKSSQQIDTEKITEIEAEEYDKNWHHWKNYRRFSSDIKLDLDEFTFNDLKIPEHDAIIGIKSPLGTAKTKALLQFAKNENNPFFILGYRNNLLFQTIARGCNIGLNIHHLNQDESSFLLADTDSNHALCVDSILKIDGYFQGRDIYLDEIVSVIYHLINGGTLGDKQAKIIKIFTKAIQECNRAFILDGNLADIHADFIQSLAPNKKLIRIDNTRKPKPHKIIFVNGIDAEGEIKKSNKSALIRRLLDNGIVPFIYCESKADTEALDKLLKAEGKNGLCINADTQIDDPKVKEFLNDPDAYINKYKPNYVIGSPTIESGISVTVKKYFTHKFSFLIGIGSVNSLNQALFRLRDDSIEHFVFCPEKSQAKNRSRPKDYFDKHIKEITESKIFQSASLAGEDANKALYQAMERSQNEWFDLACTLMGIDNFEQDNLRKCLIHVLKESGDEVSIVNLGIDKEIDKEYREVKDEILKEKSKEEFKALPIIDEDGKLDLAKASKLSQKSPKKETRLSIGKTFLLNKLPEIDQSPIWSENFIYKCIHKKREFISQQENYWRLMNYQKSQQIHEKEIYHALSAEEFFSLRIAKNKHNLIWALMELRIPELLQLSEYHKYSDLPNEIIEKLREDKRIRYALNMDIPPKTASRKEVMDTISKLLAIIGFKNVQKRKSSSVPGSEGAETRIYKAVPWQPKKNKNKPDKDNFNFLLAREEILKSLDRRHSESIESPDWSRLSDEAIKEACWIEWNDIKGDDAQWLEESAIETTAKDLILCTSSEELETLMSYTPRFAVNAAISTLQGDEINRLVNIGAYQIPFGAYKCWLFSQENNFQDF